MKKRTITLLEIMIVVLLIGIIGSVLGFNMKGSLDEGKAFKSREGAKQIRDILLMEVESQADLKSAVDDLTRVKIQTALKKSGLVSDPGKLLVDGWGDPYHFEVTETMDESGFMQYDLKVSSSRLQVYDKKKQDAKDKISSKG